MSAKAFSVQQFLIRRAFYPPPWSLYGPKFNLKGPNQVKQTPPLRRHPLCVSTKGGGCLGLSHVTFCPFPPAVPRLRKHRGGCVWLSHVTQGVELGWGLGKGGGEYFNISENNDSFLTGKGFPSSCKPSFNLLLPNVEGAVPPRRRGGTSSPGTWGGRGGCLLWSGRSGRRSGRRWEGKGWRVEFVCLLFCSNPCPYPGETGFSRHVGGGQRTSEGGGGLVLGPRLGGGGEGAVGSAKVGAE